MAVTWGALLEAGAIAEPAAALSPADAEASGAALSSDGALGTTPSSTWICEYTAATQLCSVYCINQQHLYLNQSSACSDAHTMWSMISKEKTYTYKAF